jgi:quercetin dioxygenase-like cupin family protein
LNNIGNELNRMIVVESLTAGDEVTTAKDAGFARTPEVANRWFRTYRLALRPGEVTPKHRHLAPIALVQVSNGRAVASGGKRFETFALTEPGNFACFEVGDRHEVRNVGDVAVELVEVELRRPSQ